MTKTEIVKTIANEIGLKSKQVDDVVSMFIDSLIDSDYTVIKGFGSFKWKTIKARKCHNPKTGERIQIPEKKRLSFKPSGTLKD